jgi:aspartate carbamoyltransferase catalytic subunit
LDRIVESAGEIDAQLNTTGGEVELAQTWPTGRLVAAFYEPSTRTRGSSEAGAKMLGMSVTSFPNAEAEAKSEPLEDAAVMLGAQGHILVMRHKENDAAERAAKAVDKYFSDWRKPVVVNAGSGERDHPTQALIDEYAIHNKFDGQHHDLHSVMIGGFDNRTVRSYIQTRRLYPGSRFTFVVSKDMPEGLHLPEDIAKNLGPNDEVTDDFHGALRAANIVYTGRVKNEHNEVYLAPPFVLGLAEIALMQTDARIFHALPRDGEIDPIIDDSEQAAYMQQAIGGPAVRAAVFADILQAKKRALEI